MTSFWSAVLASLLGAAVGAIVGFVHGVNVGVQDTERRWSDAVGRAGHK